MIQIVQQRDVDVDLEIKDDQGVAVNITGATIKIAVKTRPGATTALASFTSETPDNAITITNGAQGKATLAIMAEDFSSYVFPLGAKSARLFFDVLVITQALERRATREGANYIQEFELLAFVTESIVAAPEGP